MRQLPEPGDTVRNTKAGEDATVAYKEDGVIGIEADSVPDVLEYTYDEFLNSEIFEW